MLGNNIEYMVTVIISHERGVKINFTNFSFYTDTCNNNYAAIRSATALIQCFHYGGSTKSRGNWTSDVNLEITIECSLAPRNRVNKTPPPVYKSGAPKRDRREREN